MENNQFNQPSFQTPLPNATPVLVLGIISIVGCFCYGIIGLVCGIVALVLAQKDLALYAQNPTGYTPGSLSNLRAGRVCAIIGLCLSALTVICLIIEIFVVGLGVLSHPQSVWN